MVCSLRGSTVGNVLPLTASTNLLLMKHWNKDNRKVWWSCVHCRGPMVHWNCRRKKNWNNRKVQWSSVHCGDPWYIGSQSLAADTRPVLLVLQRWVYKLIVDEALKQGQQKDMVKLCPLWGPMVHWNNRKTTIGMTTGQQKGTLKLCPLWGSTVHW